MDQATKLGRAPSLRTSEKVILHLLRLHASLSKAELARRSQMSAQGVSIIVERLYDLGLVHKGQKKRGRVGQPSTPIMLNPKGALSVGIVISCAEVSIRVCDFQGTVLREARFPCAKMDRLALNRQVLGAVCALRDAIDPAIWKRCVGIGLSAREGVLEEFLPDPTKEENDSLAERLGEQVGVPVYCINDIRAACIAELTLNPDLERGSMLYMGLNRAFGAGLILEGRLPGSERRLSSNLHYLPIPGRDSVCVGDLASVQSLVDAVESKGFDFDEQAMRGFAETRAPFTAWREEALVALVEAIRAASATLPIDRVLIAGLFSEETLATLTADLGEAIDAGAGDGRLRPDLRFRQVTAAFRAQGAALVPFFKAFGMGETVTTARADDRDVA